ncbi:hypothetical protein HMPREF1982_02684 [Clostridiales bacterium oral taxon 876 str. F0540]|nr:hypothetical protein HMPREF1982_02684 [Clostridiales bacterium oral taxon 876 str. F0540]
MGLKINLGQVVSNYKQLKDELDNKIKAIQNNGQYSEEYKNELIMQEKAKFSAQKDEIKNSAVSLIEDSKQKLQDKKKSVVKDLAFELRLNNALKTIELGGKFLGKEELKNIIEPFKDDYGTIQSLFQIFRKMNIDTDDIIPTDGIEYQIKDLEDKAKAVIEGITYDNNMGMVIAISMMSDDVE